jgi:hypothetical protein
MMPPHRFEFEDEDEDEDDFLLPSSANKKAQHQPPS